MPIIKTKRKLTAILSADVVGYSRLMGEDEEHTVGTLNSYREIMTRLIDKHDGDLVDAVGDNLLAQFTSIVDAVRCAVKIQSKLKKQNENLSENRRMFFRIGINIGDVIQDNDRIYGDGVNIAARIESLAEPGGICISRGAYDHIKKKLNFGYEYIGEHNVKNILDPVRVYKVSMNTEGAEKENAERAKPSPRKWALSAILGLTIMFAIVGYQIYQKLTVPKFEPASIEKMALPLPDKPSIAVLPFDNLSDDPEQDYFSDGLTEEIITALSKINEIFVIARNSTFTYKGKPVKVQQVAQDLGVRYVLEGSVRKGKDKIRITAQLIDALTGHHLWAERYDRKLKDIFAVQDEITMKILSAFEVKLTYGEQTRIFKKGTNNLDAYLKVLQGFVYFGNLNPENNQNARRIFEEVIFQEPNYAIAYTSLASVHLNDIWLGTSKSPIESALRAEELAKKALSIDATQPMSHCVMGAISIYKGDWEEGITLLYKAVELEPNWAFGLQTLGGHLCFADKPKEAIPIIEKAIRLNPMASSGYFNTMAIAYRMLGQYDLAIEYLEKGVQRNPDYFFSRLNLSACYIMAGQEQKAYTQAKEVIGLNPNFSLDQFAMMLPSKNQEEKNMLIDALRMAGLK